MTRWNEEGIWVAIILPMALASSSSTSVRSAPTAVPTYVGCFASQAPLVKESTYKYQSSGHCWGVCSALSLPVLGLSNGTLCLCGDELPSKGSEVDKSHCSTPCAGYDLEDCGGGNEYFTVWLTGTRPKVPNHNAPKGSQSTSSTKTNKTAPTKLGPSTHSSLPITAPAPTPTASSTSSLDSGNELHRTRSHDRQRTVLGVVLGLTAFTAVLITLAVLWYCIWRPRRRSRRPSHGDKTSSMSAVPLRGGGDGASFDSASTYSSQRSIGFVERTGRAIAAMQVALSPHGRSGSSRLSRHREAPIALPEQRDGEQQPVSNSSERSHHANVDSHALRTSVGPVSPIMSMAPGFNNVMLNEPKARPVRITSDEVVSPMDHHPSERTHEAGRSLTTHYPSFSEVTGFNFSDEADDPDVEYQRESWYSWRERKEGRYELA